jgi:hypothetical protein
VNTADQWSKEKGSIQKVSDEEYEKQQDAAITVLRS